MTEKIKTVANYIAKRYEPMLGLFHGVRCENDFILFKKYLPNCAIVGTSDTIESEANNILLRNCALFYRDFVARFDFIFSYVYMDVFLPDETIYIWKNQIAENGIILLDVAKDFYLIEIESIKIIDNAIKIIDVLDFQNSKTIVIEVVNNA